MGIACCDSSQDGVSQAPPKGLRPSADALFKIMVKNLASGETVRISELTKGAKAIIIVNVASE